MVRQSFIQQTRPIWIQALFGVLIGLIVVVNTAQTDHVLHDFYVKPTIAQCFPSNQEDYCQTMRELHGVSSDAQLELGDIYWNEIARQAIMIGLILFIFRIAISATLYLNNQTRHIRLIDIYVAFLWGATASIIFIGGFLDLAYYYLQDQEIPGELAWLNDVGLFAYTQGIFGEKNLVEIEDLYITIIISFGLILVAWLFAMAWWTTQPIERVL